MGAVLQDAHRKVLRRETVAGIAVNAIVPPAIIAALGVPPPQALTGPAGALPGLIMASAAAAFLMTLIVTTVLRRAVRKGAAPALAWPRAARGWMRMLPAALPLAPAPAHAFNVGFGALVGATVSRPIVLLALAD
ncbi:MAG: hypothetical protein RL026_1943 [Pseudomonadota bacterium]